MEWWNTAVPSAAYVGNSCKESTPHPNIRQYTDTRCQSVPCRVRGGAARLSRTDWRLGFIHHPRRDAISAIFTRKASRDVPAARSSNKAPAHPTTYVCEVKPRRCRRAPILDLLFSPFMYRRTHVTVVRATRNGLCRDMIRMIRYRRGRRILSRSFHLSRKPHGSYIRRLSHPREHKSNAPNIVSKKGFWWILIVLESLRQNQNRSLNNNAWGRLNFEVKRCILYSRYELSFYVYSLFQNLMISCSRAWFFQFYNDTHDRFRVLRDI